MHQCLNSAYFRYMRHKNRCMLCISPSSLSPFSVYVSMECRFSDRGAPVAEATASFQQIHP
jgi:predicted MarR family transcription regulator